MDGRALYTNDIPLACDCDIRIFPRILGGHPILVPSLSFSTHGLVVDNDAQSPKKEKGLPAAG